MSETISELITVKSVYNGRSQKDRKLVFKTNYRSMQVKSIAGKHSAILSTFIKLPFAVNIIFVLSIFEWPLTTGFTVLVWCLLQSCQPRVTLISCFVYKDIRDL